MVLKKNKNKKTLKISNKQKKKLFEKMNKLKTVEYYKIYFKLDTKTKKELDRYNYLLLKKKEKKDKIIREKKKKEQIMYYKKSFKKNKELMKNKKNLTKKDYLKLYPECATKNLEYTSNNCQNRCLYFKKKKINKNNLFDSRICCTGPGC